jgi:hypothetical protein
LRPPFLRPAFLRPAFLRPAFLLVFRAAICPYHLSVSTDAVAPQLRTSFRIPQRTSQSIPAGVASRCPHHSLHREWPIGDRASCVYERRFQSASQHRCSGKKASTKNLREHDSIPDSRRDSERAHRRLSHHIAIDAHCIERDRRKSRSMPRCDDAIEILPRRERAVTRLHAIARTNGRPGGAARNANLLQASKLKHRACTHYETDRVIGAR